MNSLKDLGVGWLRFDVSWDDVQQGGPNSYNWGAYDRIADAAKANNIQALAILNYTPKWARQSVCAGSANCPPANMDTFAQFAATAVKRYSAKNVHAWEIWNEQNKQSYWQPRTDVAGYVQMLKATYPAIKGADPSATVLTGGVAPAASDGTDISVSNFITQLYASGGKPYFDAVSDHPYSYPVVASYGAPWNSWQQMYNTADSIRNTMVANGDSAKKIWITEFGAPTNGPGASADVNNYNFPARPTVVTENLQTQILTDAVAQYRGQSYFGPFFWYSLADLGTNTNTNENFFGLIRADGSKKPAYTAYKQIIQTSN